MGEEDLNIDVYKLWVRRERAGFYLSTLVPDCFSLSAINLLFLFIAQAPQFPCARKFHTLERGEGGANGIPFSFIHSWLLR